MRMGKRIANLFIIFSFQNRDRLEKTYRQAEKETCYFLVNPIINWCAPLTLGRSKARKESKAQNNSKNQNRDSFHFLPPSNRVRRDDLSIHPIFILASTSFSLYHLCWCDKYDAVAEKFQYLYLLSTACCSVSIIAPSSSSPVIATTMATAVATAIILPPPGTAPYQPRSQNQE